MKDIVSVWDRRFEVPRTSRSLCQRGGAGQSALAICCHDRRPRSPAFGGIASPAAVLLDETGSAADVFPRHRCSRTHQDLNLAIRQYPEQPEAEPSTKVAKPGVALTPPPARREASGKPNFVASGRPVEPRGCVEVSPCRSLGSSSPIWLLSPPALASRAPFARQRQSPCVSALRMLGLGSGA